MDGIAALEYIIANHIEGDIVECGVDAGHFEFIWINKLIELKQQRDIYMYDTFAGLTKPGEYDYTRPDSTIYEMNASQVMDEWKHNIINENVNKWCHTPLEQVQRRLSSTGYPKDKLHYIVGDVIETLDKFVPEKIAILRLDTDWYESSKIELEKMYDHVVDGGIIIFDDYYHWDGQRRATDDFFKKINKNYKIYPVDSKTGSIIKNKDCPPFN